MNALQNVFTEIKKTLDADMNTALEAVKQFQHGASTGEWEPFLAMLSDDIAFYAPVPGFVERGLLRGKDETVKLFVHHSGIST